MYRSAIKILEEIEKNGFKAYIVGGFVRDHYIKRKSSDVDICTNATPKDLKSIFVNSKISNEKYGSVSLVFNKIRFEITTFRKELKYENNRLPVKIKYIDSLEEDLKRRDFTMNTMCINSHNEVIDLLKAKNDIDEHIVRTVGSPRIKLKEDSLRILRAIRFATTLNFSLEKELKKYIIRYKKLLSKLSFHRKKEELDKIFSSPNKMKGIKLIIELNLEDVLDIRKIKNIKPTNDAIGIWSQLEVDNIYEFTKNEKELMKKIREVSKLYSLDNKILYHYGLYVCQVAAEINDIDINIIRRKYMTLPIKSIKDIQISSKEICDTLQIKPSKKIKEIYLILENKIIEGEIPNVNEVLKKYIKENLN